MALSPPTARPFTTRAFTKPGSGRSQQAAVQETLVVRDRPQIGFWGHYAVTATGLYVLDYDAEPHPTIDFYNFATGKISPVL